MKETAKGRKRSPGLAIMPAAVDYMQSAQATIIFLSTQPQRNLPRAGIKSSACRLPP
jgi:hypothetical protein